MPIHDIGKIAIADGILCKPSKVRKSQSGAGREHREIGAAILAGSRSELLQTAKTIIGSHHERWDGTGLPAGLRGQEIPLAARITAVFGVFDALRSRRRYKEALATEQAVEIIGEQGGPVLRPARVDVLLAFEETFAIARELPDDEGPRGGSGVPRGSGGEQTASAFANGRLMPWAESP